MGKQKGGYCDAQGFVVDTSSHENPGNTDPITSGYTYHVAEIGKFGTGPFSIKISGLKPGTKYYNRACAHNIAGWGYGNEVEFTTKKEGAWNKITSYLELDSIEAGFPSGIKFRFKRRD
jgi:hypothetical protein